MIKLSVMKRIVCFFISILLALALCACGGTTEHAAAGKDEGKLNIVASCFPAYDFVRNLAGDRAEITLLIPPGTEPHSFEPTAKEMLLIGSCDILIRNGGESEEWMEELLEGLDVCPSELVMLDCVQALEETEKEGMQEIHEEEEDEGEPEYDEHVWTSPTNAMLICSEIANLLYEADPSNAAVYEANLKSYLLKLEALRDEFRSVVDSASRKTMIFADRFPVRYFVEEFGLDYYAAFPGCADDVEPSAKTVAFLIDRVHEDNTPAVFYIELSNEKMADVICEDTGCKKLLFHSCQTVGADEFARGENYISLMGANVEALKEALG